MTKIIVYINSTEKYMNQFAIGYMVNPKLNVNKVLIYQVEKFLKYKFHSNNMSGIKNIFKKENTCVIVLVMFHGNRTTNPKNCLGC